MSLPYRDSLGFFGQLGHACSKLEGKWKHAGAVISWLVMLCLPSGTARDMFRGGEHEAGNPNRSGRTYHDDKILCAQRA